LIHPGFAAKLRQGDIVDTLSGNTGYWLQQAANATFLASVYALLATAYALLQGITNRIVLSFGDIATAGAFAAVSVSIWGLLAGREGLMVLIPAIAVAMAAAAVAGRLAHGLVFKPILASSGQAVTIASIGLSIVLQELLRLHSGGRDLWLPPFFGSGLPVLDGTFPVQLGYTALSTAALSVLALAGLQLLIRRTRAGRLWRAVSENPRLAALSGVNTDAVFRWSFVGAGAFAGLAGASIAANYGGVSFIMGLVLGFKAMFAAIIGGFGTLGGAIAGGIVLALLEVGWVSLFPAAYRDAFIFGFIILVLILKPEGLLGHVARRHDIP
jgi:branched-subunit amino acid ABC-type transport system permease component